MKNINMETDNMVNEADLGVSKKVVKKSRFKKILKLVLVLIMISGVFGSFYFYSKYRNLKNDPTIEAQKETARLVNILSKIMELPTDETPTVATISDKEKLKDQVFFNQAENGDILFAYTNSMKAILYRPSTNKIINVAPININQTQGVKKAVTTEPVATTDTKKK